MTALQPAELLNARSATTERARGTALLTGVLLKAFFLLAAYYLALLVLYASALVVFPYDANYGEGYVLFDAVRLARGEPIYTSIAQYPMVRSPYPPLVPALLSLAVPFAGPVFWPGRILASLSLAGIVGLVVWNGWLTRAGFWPPVVAGAMVVASPYVYQWLPFVRVDFPALVLSVAGVLVGQWVGGWRGVVGAAVLCGLAVWAKQTSISAPLAVLAAYSAAGRWRSALGFLTVIGLPSLLLLGWLELASSGQFARHVLFGNATNPFDLVRMAGLMLLFLALQLPLLLAGFWGAKAAWRISPSPVAVYMPLAFLTTFSVGNHGSAQNYFLEAIVAAALALPFAWRAISRRWPLLPPTIALVQLLLVGHLPNGGLWFPSALPLNTAPTAAAYADGAAVDAAIRGQPGEVIAEPAGFSVRNGRPVYLQPLDLRAEQYHGRWNSQPLVDDLQRGRFSLVVEWYRLFPFDMEDVLRTHFALEQELSGMNGLTYRLYRFSGESAP